MREVKAELLPLKGKYYGTEILVTVDGEYEYVIDLWNGANYRPSERELCGETEEEYEVCDNHFESKTTLEVAQYIVESINTQ